MEVKCCVYACRFVSRWIIWKYFPPFFSVSFDIPDIYPGCGGNHPSRLDGETFFRRTKVGAYLVFPRLSLSLRDPCSPHSISIRTRPSTLLDYTYPLTHGIDPVISLYISLGPHTDPSSRLLHLSSHRRPPLPLLLPCYTQVSIFIGGHISGAHHNPAVTLAVVMAGKMKTGGWEAVGADNSEAMDIDMDDDDCNVQCMTCQCVFKPLFSENVYKG